MAQRVPIDSDKGINDLVKQLGDDSKRLIANEIRLARAEARESVHTAGRGVLWLGLAFGVGVVMLVTFTLFSVTAIGRAANGNYWVGALVTAALEIGIGFWVLRRGLREFGGAPYSMPETRRGITLIRGG